jgi:Peptidase family M23
MNPWNILAVATLLVGATLSPAQTLNGAQAMEMSRKYLAEINQGSADDLWQKMTPQMQALLKDPAGWKTATSQFKAQLGNEIKVENERVVPGIHMQVYTRLSEYSAMPGKMVTTFAFNDQGQIAGFSVRPGSNPAETKYLEYKDRTKLKWPLKGEWLVYQGGRSTYDNYHAAYSDERFAYDIVGIKNGKLYSGSADKLEDFFGFGQPVFAPADGTVVGAVDQYDDNPVMKPSSSSPKQGNNVVIDHGNSEFSMMGHLKRGSVNVKAGDKIKAGQQVGECGNSGNSPFPHLHYHLQTTQEWFRGEGLPIQFLSYTADGKAVDSGEPVRGEVIQTK